MTPVDILGRCQAAGLSVRAEGDALRVIGKLPAEMRRLLSHHKPAVLAYLRNRRIAVAVSGWPGWARECWAERVCELVRAGQSWDRAADYAHTTYARAAREWGRGGPPTVGGDPSGSGDQS